MCQQETYVPLLAYVIEVAYRKYMKGVVSQMIKIYVGVI